MAQRRNGIHLMAREVGRQVLSESTRLALEKMAEEFAREALADPVFRERLRNAAHEACREAFGELAGSRRPKRARTARR